MLAGAAIGYKTKFQKAVALSSTEAEWVAACEVGKMILYFRSLLEDLGRPQHDATVMFEDNRGALFMANAQQASTRTRHIDIKHFALVDWVEQDLMILEDIKTAENSSDAMTKATAKILFYRHMDTIMGRRTPKHISFATSEATNTTATITRLFSRNHTPTFSVDTDYSSGDTTGACITIASTPPYRHQPMPTPNACASAAELFSVLRLYPP